ncbi:replication initiator [Streptomyces sp. NPDC050485]|uniref:replication initiator n=1 Tax=Streptomyces sp. NPDC050485 TaxID=3365617 RepID=UPI0037B28182
MPAVREYPSTHEARRAALAIAAYERTLSLTERDLIRMITDPGFARWREQIQAVGGCSHPIYLAGYTTTRTDAGEVLHHYDTRGEPGERLAVRCRNRRATVCEPCSRLHAGDTFHLVRSGLLGGKGVVERVQLHPRLFVTLTAPSFGSVHRAAGDTGQVCRPRRASERCEHGRPLGCFHRHPDSDTAVGQPLCPDCYDYPGHVLWHASAGRLWNRYCHTVRRHLATAAGIPQTRLKEHLTLAFAKVAEYQKRGAVHFHAVARLDGPDGPDSPPPSWATAELLDAAVRSAADAVEVRTPYTDAVGERVVRFGTQLDAHPIHSTAFAGESVVTDDAVAAYVAKYVSKSVGDAGGIDHRIRHYSAITRAPVSAHIRALMATCWRLGFLPELEELRLQAWAHTLGYRGHIITKSRHYSTTYGALRLARADHNSGGTLADWDGDPGVTTESAWRYVGSGYTLAEAECAAGIATEQSLYRDLIHEIRAVGEWRQ